MPPKERRFALALLAYIFIPLLGLPFVVVGGLTHTSWLLILGLVLVGLGGARPIVLRIALRIHGWRPAKP
jgi:hypothetical protein